MRHHLHYVFPDLQSARRALDDLLLARIESRHIHFMREGALPEDMPEANVFHKTDLVNGAERGMIAGAACGVLLGILVVWYFDIDRNSLRATAVVMAALIGLLFGGWAASLAALALPNTRLKDFADDLAQGRVLLIVDVPARRVREIEALLERTHPETRFRGEDPRVPVFP